MSTSSIHLIDCQPPLLGCRVTCWGTSLISPSSTIVAFEASTPQFVVGVMFPSVNTFELAFFNAFELDIFPLSCSLHFSNESLCKNNHQSSISPSHPTTSASEVKAPHKNSPATRAWMEEKSFHVRIHLLFNKFHAHQIYRSLIKWWIFMKPWRCSEKLSWS